MPLPKMLAFVHPIVLGVVVVVAVSVVAYEIYTHNQEKQKQRHGYGPRNSSPPPDSPKLPPSPPPTPKRDTRRRKPGKRDGSESGDPDDKQSDSGSKKSATSANEKENSKSPEDKLVNESSSNQCNLNLNCTNLEKENVYEKNVLNETSDSNHSSSHRVRRRKRSVRKSASDSAESSESSYRGKKLNAISKLKSDSRLPPSQQNHLSEQSDEPSGIDSTSGGYLSSPYSLLTEEDDTYKHKVYNNIQNEYDKVVDQDGVCFSSSSVGSSVREGLNICESGICQACEENRVNTRAEPCNHRYLCLTCARRVHRVYKRCSICRCRVVQFRII